MRDTSTCLFGFRIIRKEEMMWRKTDWVQSRNKIMGKETLPPLKRWQGERSTKCAGAGAGRIVDLGMGRRATSDSFSFLREV